MNYESAHMNSDDLFVLAKFAANDPVEYTRLMSFTHDVTTLLYLVKRGIAEKTSISDTWEEKTKPIHLSHIRDNVRPQQVKLPPPKPLPKKQATTEWIEKNKPHQHETAMKYGARYRKAVNPHVHKSLFEKMMNSYGYTRGKTHWEKTLEDTSRRYINRPIFSDEIVPEC